MSMPPPPGLNPSTPTAQPPSSLPARPPPSANPPQSSFKPTPSSTPRSNGAISRPAYNAFTAFAPRSVTSSTPRTASPAQFAVPPTPSFYNVPSGQYPPPHDGYPPKSQYNPPSYTDSSTPQIRNPFAPPSMNSGTNNAYNGAPPIDPEMEAQILQWQSAYVSKDDTKVYSSGPQRRDGATGANTAPLGNTSRFEPASPATGLPSTTTASAVATNNTTTTTTTPLPNSTMTSSDPTTTTVHRSGGGTSWSDSTLLEWDPAHFRLFVGNLAGEVTDESLLKAFSKYPSVQKARVVRDKRTTKSRGYGFVSLSDGDDYFAAGRDMQGKYIGSHPVLLKRSNIEVRASPTAAAAAAAAGNHRNRKYGKRGGRGSADGRGRGGEGGDGGGGGDDGHGKVEYGGIYKKQPKTKGGLRVLG